MAELTQLVKKSPIQPKETADSFESQVSKFITEQWTDLKSAYWVYHSWIWESILMYSGSLWVRWNSARRSYDFDAPEDEFVPRPRINRFAPAIDAIASNFQIIPEIEAVPVPKDDFQKIGIADVCNILADHFIKDTALRTDFRSDEDKVSIAGQWFTLAGCFFTNVFVEEEQVGERHVQAEQPAIGMQCVGCDTYGTVSPEEAEASGGVCPQCGEPMQMNETTAMMPQFNEDGSPMMEPITEAHVRCKIEEPLAAYPKAGAKTMQEASFMMLANRMNLDQIWSELGIEDAHADAEWPDGWNLTAENSLNFFFLGYSNFNLIGKDGALVIRLYLEPGKVKDYPDGCYAIYINGECKKCEPWPFGEEHPLTKADNKTIPTLFFARTPAFDIAGSMREFLDYSSIIKLHALTTATDPWIVDDSTNPSEISGRGDKQITFTGGPGRTAPHHAGAGSLDNGVYEMRKLTLEDIDDIAMLTAVWKGEAPANAKSGVAIDALRVQANAMFAGPTKNFANAWKETVRKGVKLFQQNYTLEQITRIVGDNRTDEIQAFQKCDLDDCIEWIATQAGMPRTKEEQKQEMIDLFDRGMLDVNDPDVREKAFELFGETGMLGTFNKDATRARYENSMIKAGGQPIFMPEIDDNKVHLDIHGDQIKSQSFLGWSPEAKQALINHYMETKAVVGAEQQQIAAIERPPNPAAPPPQPGAQQ